MLRTVAIHAPRSSRGGIGGVGKSTATAGAISRDKKIRLRSWRAIRYDAQESGVWDGFLPEVIRMNEAAVSGWGTQEQPLGIAY
jgi:hypothetical protein